MKIVVTTLLVVMIVALAGAGAFVYSGVYDVGASTPHSAASDWLMNTVRAASVARRADNLTVPELERQRLLRAGINDFEAMCVECHGRPGRAPAAMGQGLNPAPPDLADIARERSAAELFWVTKHGIKMTGMPAWGATHSDDALWPVVAVMMALPEMDAAAYAAALDAGTGMGHHGAGSEGTGASSSHARDPAASSSHPSNEATDHDHSDDEH